MQFDEFQEKYASRFDRFLEQVVPANPVSPLPFTYYAPSPGITCERHVVIDDAAEGEPVVGAIDVKVQSYSVRGEVVRVAVMKYPISLGAVNRRYAAVAPWMFRKVAETYPLNYSLGMGRADKSLVARIVEKLGWTLSSVPYLFLPVRSGALVRRVAAGRPALAGAVRAASAIGAFRVADGLFRLASSFRARGGRDIVAKRVADFDASLDAFWNRYGPQTGFTLVRDSAQLNAICPRHVPEFEKLVFERAGEVVGFAVLLVPNDAALARFGGSKTVTLTEMSFLDAHIDDGIAALVRYLFARDIDAVIANASHAKTLRALERCGFLHRQTDVTLATSPELQKLLDAHDVEFGDMVLTRSDGDGPIGLGVDL